MKRDAKYVCSVTWAKRLKEAGVRQSSIWKWVPRELYPADGSPMRTIMQLLRTDDGTIFPEYRVLFSAFSVGELGDLILKLHPDNRGHDRSHFPFRAYSPHTDKVEWKYDWPLSAYRRDTKVLNVRTEADARAAFLLALVEYQKAEKNGEMTDGVPKCLRKK